MSRKEMYILAITLLLMTGYALSITVNYIVGSAVIGANKNDFEVLYTKVNSSENNITSHKNKYKANAIIEKNQKTIIFSTQDLSVIGEWAKIEYEITNYSTSYDVETSIQCTLDNPSQQEFVNKYLAIEKYESWQDTGIIETGAKGTGWIKIFLKRDYLGDDDGISRKQISFKISIIANAVGRNNVVESSKEEISDTIVFFRDNGLTYLNNYSIKGNSKNDKLLGENGSFDLVVTGKNMLDLSNLEIFDSRQTLNEDNTLTINGNFTGGGGDWTNFAKKTVYLPSYLKETLLPVSQYFSGSYTRNDSQRRTSGLIFALNNDWQDSGVYYLSDCGNNKYYYGTVINFSAAGTNFKKIKDVMYLGIKLTIDNTFDNDITYNNYRVGLMLINSKMTECKTTAYTPLSSSNCSYEKYKEHRYKIELKDTSGNIINGMSEHDTLMFNGSKWVIKNASSETELISTTQNILNRIELWSGINNIFVEDENTIIPSNITVER